MPDLNILFSGRQLSDQDIELIRQVTADFPNLTLHELANTVSELLDWYRPNGKLKTRECVDLLQLLAAKGWLRSLPVLQRTSPRGVRSVLIDSSSEPQAPVIGELRDHLPIRLRLIDNRTDRVLFQQYIERYHYLGYRVPYGAQLRYFVHSSAPPCSVLGCLLFSSAAWKMAPRDRWIGWQDAMRRTYLSRIVNHSRFLILPWVRVPSLASHLLPRSQLDGSWSDSRTRAYGSSHSADRTRAQTHLCLSALPECPAAVVFSPFHLAIGGFALDLLTAFEALLGAWHSVFPQERTFQRAYRLTFGLLACLRQHLTSSAICTTGRQFLDWTADYRLFSRSPWDPRRLFDAVIDGALSFLAPDPMPIIVAMDDSIFRKTGLRIPGVSTWRDPLGPKYRVNFISGLRFVQASLIVSPSQPGPARDLPVRFEPAKLPRK